ncbi:MAG: prephenate dehydrogenase/arogenate dehydrogenase family protein [Candidatus Geothermincolia bacterium]
MIDRISIIGTGLMGGSLAMALKASEAVGEVVACDISPSTRADAAALGIADRIEETPASAVLGAQIVFLATPIGAMAGVIEEAAPALAEGVIISDLASAKLGVMREIQSVLPQGAYYVGGHPMTGSEQSGVRFANPELFRDRYYILTPTDSTDPDAFSKLHALLRQIGARVLSIDPESHDRAMATISHVPHLLSLLLMEMAASEQERMKSVFTVAAGGFRDMTRIAASSPEIWLDIVSENRAFIIERLQDYSSRLAGLIEMLESGDSEALGRMFDHARVARKELSVKSGADQRELFAISLPVPDEPGVLSRITTAVGALGINIEDLGIVHPLEGETGILTLRVLGEKSAAEACVLLESLGYAVSVGKA